MAGYPIRPAKYAPGGKLASGVVFFLPFYLIYTLDSTYLKTMETGAGLLIPSFILANKELSIEDKFTASTILQYLIVENEGRESTALFGELEIVLRIPEADIIRCVHLLQEMELMTCFRDKFNIGGDMTMYVGLWTRDAYLKELNNIFNDEE